MMRVPSGEYTMPCTELPWRKRTVPMRATVSAGNASPWASIGGAPGCDTVRLSIMGKRHVNMGDLLLLVSASSRLNVRVQFAPSAQVVAGVGTPTPVGCRNSPGSEYRPDRKSVV